MWDPGDHAITEGPSVRVLDVLESLPKAPSQVPFSGPRRLMRAPSLVSSPPTLYVCVWRGGAFGLHLSQDYPAEVRVNLQEPLCALCLANLGHKPILSSQQHYSVFVRHRSIVCPLCPKTTVPQDTEFHYGSRKSLIYLT